jgi:predicted Zn-dependent protease
LYQQALQEDARYAPAWARLGRVHRLIGKLGGGTSEDLVQAEAALHRALELNPDLPLAHNLLAQIDIDRGRAREAMVRLLGQASRRSTDPELFAGLVHACRYCGLLGASLRADARARRLDPSIKTSVVHTFWMLRQYEDVLAARVEAPIVMAFALVGLGRMSDALQLLTEREGKVAARVRQMIGALRALLEERHAEAIAAIRAIVGSGFRDAEGLYYMARQLAQAGAADEAVALIRNATAEGFFCAPLMQSDEWLDSLRNLPAFLDVLSLAEHEHALAVTAFTEAGGDQVLGAD